MKGLRASCLIAAALAVAGAAESASAGVVTPQVVEPQVVTPHAVTPTPAAPTTTPAPAPAPQATSAVPTSSEPPAAPQPPSPQPSSSGGPGVQVTGGRGPVPGPPSSSGYTREQADSVASFAAAFYDIAVSWKKADLANAPRSPLSLEATWTLAIQIVNAVHDSVENGGEPNLPTWEFAPRGSKDTLDPPPENRLDASKPDQTQAPTPSGDAGTPASDPGSSDPGSSDPGSSDPGAGDPADGGAAGKRVDDDAPKSEE